MEILGPTVAEQQKNHPGTGLMLQTVIQIVDQAVREFLKCELEITDGDAQLAGLEDIHSHGILHRDIKLENLLCALGHSTIKIIDFGISKPISHAPPNKYDPLKDRKTIVGSPYWASLNSHNG